MLHRLGKVPIQAASGFKPKLGYIVAHLRGLAVALRMYTLHAQQIEWQGFAVLSKPITVTPSTLSVGQ